MEVVHDVTQFFFVPSFYSRDCFAWCALGSRLFGAKKLVKAHGALLLIRVTVLHDAELLIG